MPGGAGGHAGRSLLLWLGVAILGHALVALFGVLDRWLQVAGLAKAFALGEVLHNSPPNRTPTDECVLAAQRSENTARLARGSGNTPSGAFVGPPN